MEVGISAAQGRARIPPHRLTLGKQGALPGPGLPAPAQHPRQQDPA